ALALLFKPSPHLVHPDGAWLATSTVTALAAAAAVLSASALALRLADPTAGRPGYGPLLIGPAILALGLGLELALVPSGDWAGRLWGQAPLDCMASVAGLSLPLLTAALLVLRNGATRRPSLVGGLAGLAAGSLAACLYLLHCPESSLLFTAAWHGPAILMTAALGAAAGRLILRW
ncbi:MAG: DUF1109 family protein, partial [Methylobacteriaceae bacterium]|nr:DUF1109 family protein [Methylobacteriaceae bacterium]